MFNLGITELGLIGLSILIFLKPEDIPKVIQNIRKVIYKFQKIQQSITHDLTKISIEKKENPNQPTPTTDLPSSIPRPDPSELPD